jgi:pilus assembly protein CpaE
VPLSALARDPKTVDWEMLSPRLARHDSGLCGLAQTGHLEDLRELEPSRIPLLLQNLRRQFSVVIVDGLRDFNDHALAALDTADRVLLVATQDVPAIRGAARRAAIFRRLGYSADKFLLVLNRFDRKSAVSPTLVAEEIGLAPSFTVANDFETVSRAINEGCPLDQIDADAAVSVEIAEMTRRIFGLAVPERHSFWKRLFGRKR